MDASLLSLSYEPAGAVLRVGDDTVRMLRNDANLARTPVHFVTSVGRCIGASTLLNSIAGEGVFAERAATMDPLQHVTRGIRVAQCNALGVVPAVLLADSQGWGQRGEDYDSLLSAPALLLSSALLVHRTRTLPANDTAADLALIAQVGSIIV
jgi:hypothetical protein